MLYIDLWGMSKSSFISLYTNQGGNSSKLKVGSRKHNRRQDISHKSFLHYLEN